MRRILLVLLMVAACDGDPASRADRTEREPGPAPSASPASPVAGAELQSGSEAALSEDAATVLRRYYRLIGERDYEQAARLRSRGEGDAARLAENFRAYRSYNVQVGTPGRPARSGDWLYVNVPVMITGSFRGGKTFGSAGSVTMRRAASDQASAGERAWRVYTG
jgi:hypothetical protein